MIRPQRLAQMRADLRRGLDAPDDEFRQRVALEAIVRNAHFAGVAVLDGLRQNLPLTDDAPDPVSPIPPVRHKLPAPRKETQPAETGSGGVYCRSCGRVFPSQIALNGHGQRRCQQQTTKPSLSA
jgi:hypothetical protein